MSDPTSSRLAEIQGRDAELKAIYDEANERVLDKITLETQLATYEAAHIAGLRAIADPLLSVIEGQREDRDTIKAEALTEAAAEFARAAQADIEPVLNRLAANLLLNRADRLTASAERHTRAALTAPTTEKENDVSI